MALPVSLPVSVSHTSLESVLYGLGATALALGLAIAGLYRQLLPPRLYAVVSRTYRQSACACQYVSSNWCWT